MPAVDRSIDESDYMVCLLMTRGNWDWWLRRFRLLLCSLISTNLYVYTVTLMSGDTSNRMVLLTCIWYMQDMREGDCRQSEKIMFQNVRFVLHTSKQPLKDGWIVWLYARTEGISHFSFRSQTFLPLFR